MPAEKGIFLDILPRFDLAALALILDKVQTMFKKTGAAVGQSFGAEAEAKIAALAEAERRASNVSEDAATRRTRAIHAVEIAEREATLATERRILAETRYQQIAVSTTATENSIVAAKNRVTAALIAESRAAYAASDAMLAQTARTRDAATASMLAAKASEAHSAAVAGSAVAAGNFGRVANVAGLAAGATFAYSISKAANAAGDFEEKLARLVASAGESAGNIQEVSQGIMSIASQTGYGAQELADAMYMVEKAGFRGSDGLKVLKASAQLARSENASLEEGISGLTTSMNDFHYGSDKAADVASKMVVAAGAAKTRLQEFSGALRNIEPIASVAGIKLEEVYAAMARITQSGTSPDMGSQQLANFVQHFMVIQGPQKDALAKLGLDYEQLKKGISDPNVGMFGVLNQISEAMKQRMTPEQLIHVDATYKNAAAVRALKEEFNAMSPAAQKVAQQMESGAISAKKFRAEKYKELTEADKDMLTDYASKYGKMQSFSSNLKKNSDLDETIGQMWKEATGTDAGFKVAAQLGGSDEALANSFELLKKVEAAAADPDGSVKGFHEMMNTLNNTFRQAGSSFANAGIQLGQFFMPVAKAAAATVRWLAEGLERHPMILRLITIALGGVTAAWVAWKAVAIGSAIANSAFVTAMLGGLSSIGTGIVGVIGKMTGLTTALTVSTEAGIAGYAAETAAISGTGAAAATSSAVVTSTSAANAGALATVSGAGATAAGSVGSIGPAAGLAAGEVAGAAASMEGSLAGVTAAANTARMSIMGALGLAGAAGLAIGGTLAYLQSRPETAKDIADENARGSASLDETAATAGTDETTLHDNAPYEGSFYTQGNQDNPATKAYLDSFEGLPDNLKRAEIFKAFGKGEKAQDAIMADIPGLNDKVNPPDSLQSIPGVPSPEGGFPGEAAGKGKKGKNGKDLPGGTKEDPVYTMPIPDNGLTVGGGKDGSSDSVGMNYDPFQEAGQGGWTLPNVARLMATFFANMALGNPYGKLQAAKKGESANNPLYVQDVGGKLNADGTVTITQSQLKMLNAVRAEGAAEAKYNEAVSKYGQGSPEASNAWLNVMNKKAAIEKLKAQADKYGWDLGSYGADGSDPEELLRGLDSSDPLAAEAGYGGGGKGSSKFRGFASPGATGRMAQGASGAERWRGAVRMALLKYGPGLGISNGKAWEDALVRQIATESMGDPNAQNPNDPNGKGGTQHVSGLLQFLPSTFAAHNISGGDYMNPNAQIAAALDYVKSRYGMDKNGAPLWIGRGVGYDTGGYLPPGQTTVQNDTGKPELILNPDQQEALGLQPGGSGPASAVDSGGGAAPGVAPTDGSAQVTGGSGPGFGIKGGLLGMAEGAASMAAGMGLNAVAPGAGAAAGAATDIMTQELNRAVGYIGQVAGIAAGGLLETFMLNDSPLADPGKSLFGKVAFGLAGGHPSKPNTAGAYAPPLAQKESQDQSVSPYGDLTITNNFHGTNDNAEAVQREQNRGLLMYGGSK